MYYTPKETKLIEIALYVYGKSGPSFDLREAIKNVLNIGKKTLTEFVENPLGALTYISEQTCLEFHKANEIVLWRKHPVNPKYEAVLMKIIRLFYENGNFHYYRFYEHHNSFIDVTTLDVDTLIKIICSDIERYETESNQPWFDSYYNTIFAKPWWNNN